MLRFYLISICRVDPWDYYRLFDPEELAARYFERNLGPALKKRKVAESAFQTALEDIQSRYMQAYDIMKQMTKEEPPSEFLYKLYKQGVVVGKRPRFRKGRMLAEQPITKEQLFKILLQGDYNLPR